MKYKGIEIETCVNNIAEQKDIEAVVNAANAQLKHGGGVAGALHRAAGPELEEACRSLAPISPGEAVITPAFKLPSKYVIHCLGPVYGRDEPAESLLAKCYKNAMRLVREYSIKSIAFPSISTGAFGYPVREASAIAIRSLFDEVSKAGELQKIRFVLFEDCDLRVYDDRLSEYR